jgi:hypothetical protein
MLRVEEACAGCLARELDGKHDFAFSRRLLRGNG